MCTDSKVSVYSAVRGTGFLLTFLFLLALAMPNGCATLPNGSGWGPPEDAHPFRRGQIGLTPSS